MVVVLHRIGMGTSRWWDLSICDVCYMLFIRGTLGGVSVMCAMLGCAAEVCLLAAVLCGSTAVHIWCLLLVGFCYVLCVLSILCICGDLCVHSVLCVSVLIFLLRGVVFGSSMTGSQTCLVIVACHCDGNCHLALSHSTVHYITTVSCHLYLLV